MPASENELVTMTQVTLNAVSRFLRCKTREEAEPVVTELEQLYKKCLTDFSEYVIRPDFAGVVGYCAYALSIYYVQYWFVSEDAAKYSRAAMNLLKLSTDAYPNDNDKVYLIAYTTACENTAYMAFYNKEYYDVIDLVNNLDATTFSLALAATALTMIANGERNPDKARAALKMYDLLDEQIKEPATKPQVEDAYRSAYTFYALMLVRNHIDYPDSGFTQDIHKALYVLRRGMSLIHDEEYISWLQADYDEYAAML